MTHWDATAGYTDDRSHILFTVMSKHELSMLKQEMKYIDPKAFVVSKDNVGIEGRFAKHLVVSGQGNPFRGAAYSNNTKERNIPEYFL